MRKKLEELNLLDNFLFGKLVTYPELGEDFARILLRTVFGREYKHLTIFPQKVYYGENTNLHGARLDVYMEEETDEAECELSQPASVYDIEPDKKDSPKHIKVLPRRVRFYHAKIDSKSLKSGESYGRLKNVAVIMITPYDPFGLNRMVYTVKNRCVEEPDMEYEDGACTLFLYTKGTEGCPGEKLGQLLHYMEDTVPENAVNNDLQTIQQMVEKVRKDSEVTVEYMRIMEEEEFLKEEGRRIGQTEGALKKLISLVCRKLRKGKTAEEIATDLEEDIEQIRNICEAAQDLAPEYDKDSIYEKLMEQEGCKMS